jgi:CrcB protein
MNTLWVGLGGALGSIARYHVGRLAAARAPSFPWGTLLVNLAGSLLMGFLLALALRGRVSEEVRLALGVGVLGGFTTYSSFNAETLALAQAGAWTRAAAYVAVTLVGALALGLLGWRLGRLG